MSQVHEIWTHASAFLREQMSEDTFQISIAKITPVRLDEDAIVLGVPAGYWKEWLSDNYSAPIAEGIRAACGLTLRVVFESGYKAPETKVPANPVPSEEPSAKGTALPPPKEERGLVDLEDNQMPLDRRFTFDSFVIGETNRFAYGACMNVAQHPGERLNPLFLYSGTGLGKTHLLQAIAQEIMRRDPKARVMYVHSEDYLNQFVDAIYHKKTFEFRQRFRNLDVLLLDDVQFIGGNKQGLQEEIFNTFNVLYLARKQIVMASDRPPHEIGGLEKRLVSRFEWGLTTEIEVPDLETRLAIIHKKQEEQDYKLDEEVIRFLASRLKSNVRRLESAVFKLVSWASLNNVKIDIATTEEMLSDILSEEADSLLTIEDIQKVVAEYYDIRLADMTSPRRTANIALPRQVAMYLARKLTELSLPAIAEKFNRTHATILHAVDAIEEKIAESESLRREVQQLERKMKSR
ncbi:MAG: chromosomal replication initiator protein DnaA [Victivallales bacterium]|nr:chromosomal replication initiator protein DnaA [Victivallales bacterium]